jgi:hypothetical protein
LSIAFAIGNARWDEVARASNEYGAWTGDESGHDGNDGAWRLSARANDNASAVILKSRLTGCAGA